MGCGRWISSCCVRHRIWGSWRDALNPTFRGRCDSSRVAGEPDAPRAHLKVAIALAEAQHAEALREVLLNAVIEYDQKLA